MGRAAISGSAPNHSGDRRESAAVPATRVRVTVVLRPREPDVAAALLSGKYDPREHAPPGADETSMAAVETYLRTSGLAIEESDAASRTIVATGSASQANRAFGIDLAWFESPGGAKYLSYDGDIALPSEIAGSVLAVLGLDARPAAQPRR